jgi:hypothetical protein
LSFPKRRARAQRRRERELVDGMLGARLYRERMGAVDVDGRFYN